MKYFQLTICFLALIFFARTTAFSQTGVVPALKDVAEAAKIVRTELQLVNDEITNIANKGGIPGQELIDKQRLFFTIMEYLETNNPGTTTFLALGNSCNYLGLKADDEAFQDFIGGIWDENFTRLIDILAK
ncbi:MAG TPA: hypothetical protein PLS73_09150 [Saprospiraceae bacterium]|nr:hypothetical protein [Saprospiraceae bacterium]